jgi:flavodoxin
MNIGIIVYSKTGNTYSVAQKLKEKFLKDGHDVKIEKVIPEGDVHPGSKNIQLKTAPDTVKYDLIVFGSPVQAFSLATVMDCYLKQTGSLRDKKIACYVTQYFPYPWLGGNRAVSQMKKICRSKNGTVSITGIVNWSNKKREKMIIDVIEKLTGIY